MTTMPDFTPPSKSFILAYLGSCLALILLGIGCFWLDTMLRTEQRRLAEWPSTQGILYLARVVRLPLRSDAGTTGDMQYRPEVAYAYTVDTKPYAGNRLAPITPETDSVEAAVDILVPLVPEIRSGATATPSAIEERCVLPIGRTVTVYYNPANPLDAMLDRTIPEHGWPLDRAGTLCFAGAGAGLFLLFKKPRPRALVPQT